MRFSGVTPVILGVLNFGPRSGYDIKQLVDKSTRFFWAASYGQIYPELRRLDQAGLVEATPEQRGRRPRNVYRLTEDGREALRSWIREPSATYELRDESLLKLFFASAVDVEGAVGVVRAMREEREGRLARLLEIERSGKAATTGAALVLEFGIESYSAAIEWCRRAEERLLAKEQTTNGTRRSPK